MADFKQINEARKLLGLDEIATLEEIRNRYKELVLKFHPDRCEEEDKKHCEEVIKNINHAKDVLLSYCTNYRYSFREKDVTKNTIDKELYKHLKRFYDGWWGDLDL